MTGDLNSESIDREFIVCSSK